MKKKKLLDSYALLMYLKQEKGFEKIVTELNVAEQTKSFILINEINIGEICYIAAKNNLIKDINSFLQILFMLPIIRIHPDFEMIVQAAEVKAKYPISFADAFAVATAKRENAIIITGDPEFKLVEDVVEIDWLKRD